MMANPQSAIKNQQSKDALGYQKKFAVIIPSTNTIVECLFPA
jgi:hypothetical protein